MAVLRTESRWIMAIVHSALNSWGQYAFKFASGDGQRSDVLVLASGGLALITIGTTAKSALRLASGLMAINESRASGSTNTTAIAHPFATRQDRSAVLNSPSAASQPSFAGVE